MSLRCTPIYLTPFVEQPKACTNLSLLSDRLNGSIDEPDRKEHAAKDRALELREGFKLTKPVHEAYGLAFSRRETSLSALPDADVIEIESTSAVILGSGNPSVHESGMNLLRPWGVPFISGASIKGSLSSYLAAHGGHEWSRSLPQKGVAQVQLFGGNHGNSSYMGSVAFLDAWMRPNPGPWFRKDIINPHYQSYYAGRGVPDGTDNPVPIQIAALRPGLRFQVVLVGDARDRAFARSALRHALADSGLGAKTAVGYGRFRVLESASEKEARLRCATPEELAQMYADEESLLSNFEGVFREKLASTPYSEPLERLMLRLFPARVLLHHLEKGNVRNLKEGRKLRDRFAGRLRGKHVDAGDPDVQEVFRYFISQGIVKQPEDIADTWLNAFAYGWERVTISEDTVDGLLDAVRRGTWVWPPVDGLIEALANAPLETDAKKLALMEAEEILSS